MTNTQIITEIAIQNRFFANCKKIACCGLEDDLYQEFLLILFDLEKLPEIYFEPFFEPYCHRIIFNLYTSKSNSFFKNYRIVPLEIDIATLKITDTGIDRCIELELNKATEYERDLFYYVELLGSARKVSAKTHIPLASILATLAKLKEKIKNSDSCRECLGK